MNLKLPKYLLPETKKFMKTVIDELTEKKMLSEIDSGCLLMMAENYNIFLKSMEELNKGSLTFLSDRGNVSPNPLLRIAKDAESVYLQIMKEFGLSPLSRNKLSDDSKDSGEVSPLEQFINQSKEIR